MVNVESNLAVAYRKNITLAASNPTEAIVFGTLTKYDPYILLPLNIEQRFAIDRAKNYALEQSIQNALNKQAATLQQQDVKAIKRAQSLVLLSRIYVGSISFEINDDDLRRLFSPYGPIKSIALSWDPAIQKHKGFAFIEFDLPEAAGLALEQMNGHLLGGRNLRVGRPSNVPQSGSLEAEIRSEDSVKNRVYVASVHSELTDSDIQTVFEAFGKITECTLIADPKNPGRHRNFGYIEFEEESAAIAAVTSMNGFTLAGPQLRVCRALTAKDSPLLAAVTSGTVATVSSVAACKMGGGPASTPTGATTTATALAGDTTGLGLTGALFAVAPTQVSFSPSSKTGFSQAPAPVANLPPPGIFIPTALGSGSLCVPPTQQPDEEPSNGEKESLTEQPAAEVGAGQVGGSNSDKQGPIPPATELVEPTSHLTDQSLIQPTPLELPSDAIPAAAQSEEEVVEQPEEEKSVDVNMDGDAMFDQLPPDQLIDEEGEDDATDIPLSRVLLLENMIGSQEEADDGLREEVAEECSNYGGDVIRVLIHVTTVSASTEEGDTSSVRIFVQFDHHGAAVVARNALNGRFFAGRVVLASLYDEERFQLHELDDPVSVD